MSYIGRYLQYVYAIPPLYILRGARGARADDDAADDVAAASAAAAAAEGKLSLSVRMIDS